MINIYNAAHVISVSFYHTDLMSNIRFVPERKNWFGKVVKEYFYKDYFGKISREEIINMGLIIRETNSVWSPYKVVISFSDKSSEIFKFTNKEEALEKHLDILKTLRGLGVKFVLFEK